MRYWLMKSEPDTFSITDLARVKIEPWSGVRSFFARAHLRAMSVGDLALFYHSSTNPPGVAGIAKIVKVNVIDETQFDPASPYYEPKATREKHVWDCVDVEFVETVPHYVSLTRMRHDPDLADMVLLKPGRLSVQPVTDAEYARIVALSKVAPPPEVKVAKTKKPIAKKPVAKKPAAKKTTKPATKRRAR